MSVERGGWLREAVFNGNSVARRLIVVVVLFSSCITAVITALELATHYRSDLRRIDRSIEFIASSYLPSLTESVWVSDHEQVQTQLDGLLRLPDVEFIGIEVDGRMRWSAGKIVSQRVVRADATLVRTHRGEPLTIGTVRVVASVDRVLERLWDELVVVLAGNAVKTALVAVFTLLAFQLLVTRHLTRLARFVRAIDPAAPQGEQLALERAPTGRWRPDVLDTLAGSVNALSTSLARSHVVLQRSEARLRALTSQTTAYIYEVDPDGIIVFANRTYEQLSRDEVEGTPLVQWFPPAFRPTIEGALARVFGHGEPERLEYTLDDPAGRTHAYAATLVPLRRDGRVVSAVLTALDISEQKAAEHQIRELNRGLEARVQERTAALQLAVERAEAASRAKSEFLSRMSHELRTPMNAILGFAQIIGMSRPTPEQARWAEEIRRAGDHLLRMIEDLLDLARIEVGKVGIRLEPLAVPPVLAEALAIVQPLVDARALQLVVDDRLDAGVRARADRLRLRQVLVNLLSNAAKYNRDGGRITVRCERRAARLRIAVADTGHGIEPAQLARLFQPFERLGAEAGPIEGTGIGLVLSRQLAELMGATLEVHSEPGTGSTFTLELACAEGEEAASAAPATSPAVPPQAPIDVLYIEDNRSNTEVVATFFAGHPHLRLRSAADAGAGLASARHERPDIVLLDIHLPRVDGYEALAQLRADPALRDLPVVALSADAMPHEIRRALDAGFDRYLAKPVDLTQLRETVETLVAAARARPAPGVG